MYIYVSIVKNILLEVYKFTYCMYLLRSCYKIQCFRKKGTICFTHRKNTLKKKVYMNRGVVRTERQRYGLSSPLLTQENVALFLTKIHCEYRYERYGNR